MNIENKYKAVKLVYKTTAAVYCPLGKDWGFVDITATVYPEKELLDYNDIDSFITSQIDGSTHITEEVGYLIYEYIKDAITPHDLVVEVHSQNTTMHDCTTTITE